MAEENAPASPALEAATQNAAGQAPAAKQDASQADAPKSFDEKYVSELREEAKGYRTQLRDTQAALKEAQTAAGENKALADKLAGLETQLAQAAAKAEAAEKAAAFVRLAAKAGVDPDVAALLDVSKFDLSDEKKALEALGKLASKSTGSQARPGGSGAGETDEQLRARLFGGNRKTTIFGG